MKLNIKVMPSLTAASGTGLNTAQTQTGKSISQNTKVMQTLLSILQSTKVTLG